MNVLLIVIDQFRADLLDGRFAGIARLPNLKRLACRSAMFRQHFSVISPCGPSRVSLLTGQYGMNHRAVRNGTPLRHDAPNLAKSARAAGYDPLLFGYTDTAQDPRALAPDDPRLHSYEELMPGFTEVVRMRLETDDEEWRSDLRAKGYTVPEGYGLYQPQEPHLSAPALYAAEDSDTAFLTNRFLDHMSGANRGWFAMLNYIRPHPPFVAPAPYNTMFDPLDMPPPDSAIGNTPHRFDAEARRASHPAKTVAGLPDIPDDLTTTAQLRATYLGLAAEVDHHIGRVLDWLEASGQDDETVLILTADHGEMLGDFGLWGKGSYQDQCYHVPLMIRAPGLSPGIVQEMTESVDLAPTILDLIGAEIPASMDGHSLRPLLEGWAGPWKSISFSEQDFGNPISPTAIQAGLEADADAANFAVLRESSLRLVHFANGLPQVLFDMCADGFSRDLAQTDDGARKCLDLSRKMLCHRMCNPEGTFAGTLITGDGVQTAPSRRGLGD